MNSTIGLLKGYKKPPKNGLAIFCGLVEIQGKEKKIALAFEPLVPINQGFYLCDNKFHVESLKKQLTTCGKSFGFIVCNGDGTLYGKVNGGSKEILLTLKDPNLPKKHDKGGQSAARFARNTEQARQAYLKRAAETASKVFIKDDYLPSVSAIFIAGCGPLKYKLTSYMDKRLEMITSSDLLDTSYGGRIGFQQAIEMASSKIENHKYMSEKQIIDSFMKEVALNTGKYVFGVKETMKLVEMGFTSKIIASETLNTIRVVTENDVYYLPDEEKVNNLKEEIIEKNYLIDYLIEREDLKVEIVSESTSEGNQFSKGFGGLGAFLKFQFEDNSDLIQIEEDVSDDEDINDDDYDLSEFIKLLFITFQLL